MGEKEDILKGLQEFRQQLSKDIPLEKMIFFGSKSTGKGRPDSDIDLILVSNNFRGKRFRDRPLGFRRKWSLDYPVDFLCYTPEEFQKKSSQVTIVREAVREGIEVN